MTNWTPAKMDAIPLKVVMGVVGPHYITVDRDGENTSEDSD